MSHDLREFLIVVRRALRLILHWLDAQLGKNKRKQPK